MQTDLGMLIYPTEYRLGLASHMIVKEINSEKTWAFNSEGFQETVDSHCFAGLKQFKKIVRSYIFLHFFFIGLLTAEIIAFCFFLTFLSQSVLIAFSLAGIVLSSFAYLVLLFYFQTKKPEQFVVLRNWFMELCRKDFPKNLEHSEYYLSLANAAYCFSSHLGIQESTLALPSQKANLQYLMRKFSNFCYRKDLHKMKEILLLLSVQEHIPLIKKCPTNVEAHASLANAYVALAKHYQALTSASKDFQEKHDVITKKAIQEFKIIDHYSENDPWVHAQIASCYHDLKMFTEEIREYETILRFCPHDKQIMFRLGILYFQQDLSAKGLQIYGELKTLNFSRADELITFYDTSLRA